MARDAAASRARRRRKRAPTSTRRNEAGTKSRGNLLNDAPAGCIVAMIGSTQCARTTRAACDGRKNEPAGSPDQVIRVSGRGKPHCLKTAGSSQRGGRSRTGGGWFVGAPSSCSASATVELTHVARRRPGPRQRRQSNPSGSCSTAAATSQSQSGRHAPCVSRWTENSASWSSAARIRMSTPSRRACAARPQASSKLGRSRAIPLLIPSP